MNDGGGGALQPTEWLGINNTKNLNLQKRILYQEIMKKLIRY